MRRPRRKRRLSVHRITGYRFEVSADFDYQQVDSELALGLRAGCVTQYAVANKFVWFDGHPGAQLRLVRQRVAALLGPTARRVR